MPITRIRKHGLTTVLVVFEDGWSVVTGERQLLDRDAFNRLLRDRGRGDVSAPEGMTWQDYVVDVFQRSNEDRDG